MELMFFFFRFWLEVSRGLFSSGTWNLPNLFIHLKVSNLVFIENKI